MADILLLVGVLITLLGAAISYIVRNEKRLSTLETQRAELAANSQEHKERLDDARRKLAELAGRVESLSGDVNGLGRRVDTDNKALERSVGEIETWITNLRIELEKTKGDLRPTVGAPELDALRDRITEIGASVQALSFSGGFAPVDPIRTSLLGVIGTLRSILASTWPDDPSGDV